MALHVYQQTGAKCRNIEKLNIITPAHDLERLRSFVRLGMRVYIQQFEADSYYSGHLQYVGCAVNEALKYLQFTAMCWFLFQLCGLCNSSARIVSCCGKCECFV